MDLLDILLLALALGDLLKDVAETLSADTAWSTLSAGLINCEVEVELSYVDDTVILVHYNHSTGTHHGTDSLESAEIDRRIEVLLCDNTAGRTAGLHSLELLAMGDSAADIIYDLAERCSHRNLYKTRVADLACEGEYLCSMAILGTDGCEPLAAVIDDLRDICPCLNIIDDSRLAPETLVSREWRTWLRHTPVSLDGLEKSSFLSADECASAESDLDIIIKA